MALTKIHEKLMQFLNNLQLASGSPKPKPVFRRDLHHAIHNMPAKEFDAHLLVLIQSKYIEYRIANAIEWKAAGFKRRPLKCLMYMLTPTGRKFLKEKGYLI